MAISNYRSRRTRGFTLTEAAIVLGIVGLILGAIWVAAASVYSNLRVSTANKQLMTIVQNMRSLYASSATIAAGIQESDLLAAGIFPGDTNPGSGNPRNGWGGQINVGRAQGTIAGDSFFVRFVDIPQAACVNMAVSNSGEGRDAGLIGVAIAAANCGDASCGVPASPTYAVSSVCTSATGNTNTVTFTFRLKG